MSPTTASKPVAAPAAQKRGRASQLSRFVQRNGSWAVLILMVIVMAFAFDGFLTGSNLGQIARQASFYAPLALGLTFVIFTGGIDLSIGSLYALGGVIAAWASSAGFIPALLAPLVVCGLIGLVQGMIVAGTRIPAFIVTLAGMMFARGLVLFITDEGSITHHVTASSHFTSLANGSILGVGLELTAISAVVLGGTMLTGGSGTIIGSLAGITILQLVANLINRLGLSNSNWQSVVNGVLLVVVAVAQTYLSRMQARNKGDAATAEEAAKNAPEPEPAIPGT